MQELSDKEKKNRRGEYKMQELSDKLNEKFPSMKETLTACGEIGKKIFDVVTYPILWLGEWYVNQYKKIAK